MIHRLCASCGRNCAPTNVIELRGEFHHVIVKLCGDCADPARFSVNQLADAIIAEFSRQLSPTSQKGNPK